MQQNDFGKLCIEKAGPEQGRNRWCDRVIDTRLCAHTVLVNVHHLVPSQYSGFPLRQEEGNTTPSKGGCFQPSRAVSFLGSEVVLNHDTVFSNDVDVLNTLDQQFFLRL